MSTKKPKFNIGDRVHISKYDLPFRKGYQLNFTREVPEIVAFSSRKLPTYTIRYEQDEVICRKINQKVLIKTIPKWKRFQ